MRTGLHAIGEGLQRVAIGLGMLVVLGLFLFMALVTVLVVGQAAATFGQ